MASRLFRDEVAAARNELIVRLPFDVFSMYRDQLFGETAAMGFAMINMQHSMVLRAMDPAGSLMRDVTRRSGASRQVIARIVTELSVDGYLSVTVDPRDRRNQMLRFTPLGRRLARASITAGKRVEAAMARRLGVQGVSQLRGLLQTLTGRRATTSSSDPGSRPSATARSR